MKDYSMMLSRHGSNEFSSNITELIGMYFRDNNIVYERKPHMEIQKATNKLLVFDIIANASIIGTLSAKKSNNEFYIESISLDIDYDLSRYIGYQLDFAKSWLGEIT